MPSSTTSRRAERKEHEIALRRAHIIEAGASEFAEKGFHGAQVADIANRAQVSLATVYEMFQAKDGLFQAVIQATATSIREAVRAKVEAIPDGRERLLALIDSLFACFSENADLLKIYARGTHGLPWRIRQSMGDSAQEIFASFTEWVVALAREAADAGHVRVAQPEALALSLIGAVTTTAAALAEGTTREGWDTLAAGVRDVFERVIEKGGSA